MDFQTFVEKVTQEIQRMCPDKKVVVQEVYKNNDIKLTGLTITGDNKRISPTLYLERFYEDICQGFNIAVIAANIISEWEKYSLQDISSDVISSLYVYETVKDKILLKMVNRKTNLNRLKLIPYKEYLDEFALICVVDVDFGTDDNINRGSININDSLLKLWNVSKEELFRQAYVNTKERYTPLIVKMEDMMFKILKEKGIEDSDMREALQYFGENDSNMLILSNNDTVYGAVMIIFDEVIEELADRIGHSFYMIPSSVHEWIIISCKTESLDIDYLKSMIAEVNKNEVDCQEVLSNNLYYYDYEEKKIRMAQ